MPLKPVADSNYPLILCIGAFDPSGRTGLAMDIKTGHSLGVGVSAIATGLYARTGTKALARHILPVEFIAEQIKSAGPLDQYDAIKVGDLFQADIIDLVADAIDQVDKTKIVLDPVMFTHCQSFKMNADDRGALKRRMLVKTHVVTPTAEEAELLSGAKIKNVDDLKHVAETLMTLGPSSVVIRGTSFDDTKIVDIVHSDNSDIIFETETNVQRYRARGISASLTAAIAAEIAKGRNVVNAIHNARQFVSMAVESIEPSTQKNHFDTIDPLYAMQKLYELGL